MKQPDSGPIVNLDCQVKSVVVLISINKLKNVRGRGDSESLLLLELDSTTNTTVLISL